MVNDVVGSTNGDLLDDIIASCRIIISVERIL